MKATPEGVDMEKKTVTIGGNFSFQRDRVTNVINALDAGDISECKAPDVKHVSELLENLRLLFDLSPPGWLDSLFAEYLPMLIHVKHRQHQEEQILSRFFKAGLGQEAASILQAARSPNQKGLVEALVRLEMQRTGGNETEAMKTVASLMDRDSESIRRTMNRSKGRKK